MERRAYHHRKAAMAGGHWHNHAAVQLKCLMCSRQAELQLCSCERQCTTRRQCRYHIRGRERGRLCASSPRRLDTNTNILHELHSHTSVRNRNLAEEITSHNIPQDQNGNCRATRLQRKGDAATKRDSDVVGKYRDHPSAKGNRIRPLVKATSSVKRPRGR